MEIKLPLLFAVAFGLIISSIGNTLAASSDWYTMEGAKIRMIAQPSSEDSTIDAAIEVKLNKGWKTYWRNPGNSGIPLQLNFSRSSNVKQARLLYPVPAILTGKYGSYVGYKNNVVFPIEVIPADPNKPVELVADMLIGICAEICIPVQTRFEIPASKFSASTIDENRALIAGRSALPGLPSDLQYVVSMKIQKSAPGNLIVEAKVPADAQTIELHVEGPEDWYLVPGELFKREGDTAWFNVDVADIPEEETAANTELRVTLVADKAGIEQKLQVSEVE